MATTSPGLRIADIDIRGRTRKEMGNITALADSIREVGLLQPIVVTQDKQLVAGRRRLEACKRLGWQSVPVVIATSVDSLLKLLKAESDENTLRKDFTPEEAVRMGQRIEAEVSKLAKEEQNKGHQRGGKTAGKGRPKDSSRESCPKAKQDESKRTREQVASTVGMSGRQYEKAKAVIESGDQAAIDQMNATGKVDPAHRRIKREEKRKQLREKAEQAATVEKPEWSIIQGDALIELPSMECARLIFADPPYNIGVDYGDGPKADLLYGAKYLSWCQRWIVQCVDALTPDGSLWVMICDEWAADFGGMLADAGLHRRAWIKWYETFGVNTTNNFNRCSRHIFYCVVDPKQFVFNAHSPYIRRPSDRQAKYGDKRADPDGKLLDDVWEVPRLVENSEERLPDFPTQVPLEIMRRIIACASEPGDLVIDPFCGSGSTGHAALELGRQFIGIEKGKLFCNQATIRLAGVTPFAADAQ